MPRRTRHEQNNINARRRLNILDRGNNYNNYRVVRRRLREADPNITHGFLPYIDQNGMLRENYNISHIVQPTLDPFFQDMGFSSTDERSNITSDSDASYADRTLASFPSNSASSQSSTTENPPTAHSHPSGYSSNSPVYSLHSSASSPPRDMSLYERRNQREFERQQNRDIRDMYFRQYPQNVLWENDDLSVISDLTLPSFAEDEENSSG